MMFRTRSRCNSTILSKVSTQQYPVPRAIGFPGISNPITGSTISVANIVVFMLGLIVCFIILKFGTQLADTVSDTYKNYRTWTPLLAYFFQIVAIGMLYSVTNGIAQP